MVEIFVLLFQQLREIFQRWQFQLLGEVRLTSRQVAFQRLTTFVQVLVFFRPFREGDVRQFFYLLIGHWNVETVADITHAVHVHFLNPVSDVLTFCGITHAVTFDGVGQITVALPLVSRAFFSAA